MTSRTANVSALDLMLGSLGMALIALLGWACEEEPGDVRASALRARRAAAWLVIQSVTAIGWAFDRIAPVGVRTETNGRAAPGVSQRSLGRG